MDSSGDHSLVPIHMITNTRRIGPPLLRSTSAELRRLRGRRGALPPDLLRQASLRLGVMSLLGAALWALGTALGHIRFRTTEWGGEYFLAPLALPNDAIAGASILLSVALFAYTRRSRAEPERILDLGLVYMVLTALALGLMFHIGMIVDPTRYPADSVWHPELSWIGAVVLMFAAIVPTAPTKMLVAGLAAASMNPIATMIAGARHGGAMSPVGNALLAHYPDYLLGRRRGRHLPCRHTARPAAHESARDGELRARRADRPRRHG
jgi:hypothetical protein